MRAEQARRADLREYLTSRGENLKSDGGGNYTLKAPGFKLSVKNGYWRCFEGSVGGRESGNALDLAMGLYGMGFREAVDELSKARAREASPESGPRRDGGSRADIPPLAADSSEALAYLAGARKINPRIAGRLAEGGYVRQTAGRPPNAAFMIYDSSGRCRGCEMRGTTPKRFFRCATDAGWPFNFTVGGGAAVKGAYVFESAVDAISFWELHEGGLRGALLASAHGIGNFTSAIEVLRSAYSLGEGQICLCADSDAAGSEYAEAHPEYKRLRVKEPWKDWNDYLRSLKS
jgi:hypothetical protein